MDPQQEKLITLLKKLKKTYWLKMDVVGVEKSCGLVDGDCEAPGTWPVGMIGGWLLEELIKKAEAELDRRLAVDKTRGSK